MKRILINATQNEEIRVALCKGNHLYDFDLENRTREQKKSNIYKGHVTRVEPSLEAVFVEYGSQRQGFLPIREISSEYLSGNPRDENIKKLIKEGDELIVQVEKEERGNKGAALSTYVSLAGRYLVLMPNNPRGGGISRQISGKLREDMKRMLSNLDLAKGMSVIIRTAGIGKTQEDLQHDLNHLLNIWQAIQEQNQKYPSPRLVHQEAGVVTRAVRDYLRDDISEIWIDNENAYIEAAGFIDAVMPKQAEKLRKYTDYEPMFSRFNIEKQIETAYQREVRLPSGGSIVIDQTEALVSIDINSAKSTKGADVSETAYHTNLEAADEIARQLRLRDMGGLIVIDFIDMNDNKNQKEVEKRLIDATKYDRARVQFGDISKFGLMEMSRQRLRPSLEESTGYICPRCHGNGMIRDLRSLSLSIMRQIEQIALKERQGEVQAEVPTDIAAFLLNEKRDALVYLEQDSGTRITILPHAHLESPNFKLHFNRDGFAPSSYERITDTQQQEHSDLGYDVDWQTAEKERPEQQPTRQPRSGSESTDSKQQSNTVSHSNERRNNDQRNDERNDQRNQQVQQPTRSQPVENSKPAAAATSQPTTAQVSPTQPQAVAWLSNLFAQAPQAQMAGSVNSGDAAQAIETLVNNGAQSLGSFGQVNNSALAQAQDSAASQQKEDRTTTTDNEQQQSRRSANDDNKDSKTDDRRRRKPRKSRSSKPHQRKEQRDDSGNDTSSSDEQSTAHTAKDDQDHKQTNDKRSSARGNERNNERNRSRHTNDKNSSDATPNDASHSERQNEANEEQARAKRKPHSKRSSRGSLERGETITADSSNRQSNARRDQDPNEVTLQVNEAPAKLKSKEVVHLSLDDSKSDSKSEQSSSQAAKDNQSDRDKEAKATTHTSKPSDNDSQTKPEESKADATASDNGAAVNTYKTDVKKDDTADKKPSKDQQSNTATATDSQLPVVEAASDQGNTSATAQTEQESQETPTHATSSKDSGDNRGINSADKNSADKTDASSAASVLDYSQLFASRYVTAEKFGQASNDPRVVRRQQAKAQPAAVPSAQSTPAPSLIRGSVGEFIQATLPDASTRLADEGVIQCFIAAIAKHTEQASTGGETSKDAEQPVAQEDTQENSVFDFSNYGYAPLTKDYLAQFSAMTQAVSQFAAEQGKTEVTPTPIGKRASNDPRGQHADYQEPTIAAATAEEPNAQSPSATVDAQAIDANVLVSELQSDDVSADSERLLEADQELSANDAAHADQSNEAAVEDAQDTSSEKEDNQAGKSKTTIASYKNMIENVAEQLLPQKGMFNLTTPKVPKARTRKPKTEHKKPTQAEKADASDSDNDTES